MKKLEKILEKKTLVKPKKPAKKNLSVESKPRKQVKKMYDLIVKDSLETFKKKGSLIPRIVLVCNDEKMFVTPLDECNDGEDRMSVMKILAQTTVENKTNIDVAIVVAEAWLSVADQDAKLV